MCVGGGTTQRWRPHSDAPVSAFVPTPTPPPHVFFTFRRGTAASVCGQQPNAVRKRGQGLFKWTQKSASVKQPNFRITLHDWWAARCDCGPLTHHFFINACLSYQPKPTRPRNPAGVSVLPGRRQLLQRQLGFQGKAAVCCANILFWSNKLNILMFLFFSPGILTSTRSLYWRLTARCSGARNAVLRMLGSAPRSSRALQLSGLFFSTA